MNSKTSSKRKIKYVLPIILALTLLLSFSQVHATITYNWVQNAGFDDVGGNVLVNSGFESGAFFPYWTNSSGADVLPWSPPHNGTYVAYISYPSNYVMQNLSSPIDVSTVTLFRFWWYNNAQEGEYYVRVTVCWTNSTSTSFFKTVECWIEGVFIWCEVDCTSNLGETGMINAIKIDAYAKSGVLDDVELITTGSGGQDTVSADSYPWYSAEDYVYTGINTAGLAHSGSACFYAGYSEELNPLCQDFNFLPSSSISSISLWAWTQSSEDVKVKFTLIYSDRTFTSKFSLGFKDTDGWIELTFSGFVLPNKLIVQIQITVQGWDPIYYSGPSYNHIDDVSVLSTLPSSTVGFYWEAFPSPIENTSISFTQYQGVSEQLTCYVYNSDGDLAGDGTFNVTTSKGTQLGTINGGTFSFPVIGTTAVFDTSEAIIIMFNSQGSIFNGTVQLTAYWLAISEEGGGTGDLGIPLYMITWLNLGVVFAVVFVPPLAVSILVRKVKGDAMVGFIAGMALSIVVGVIVKDSAGNSIVPLWGLFIIALVLAYSIFAKVREK